MTERKKKKKKVISSSLQTQTQTQTQTTMSKYICRRIKSGLGLSLFRRFFRYVFHQILVCSSKDANPYRYRRMSRQHHKMEDNEFELETTSSPQFDQDSHFVPLKISLLGDCQIGKTAFLVKYVGDEQERKSLQMKGLNLMDKNLYVKGATIAFSFWDVGGDASSIDYLPIACKDSVAIFFMFDLTSRTTLHSVIKWYTQAKRWNKMAIPVLIGTKFDDFVRLPPNLQSIIITQAREYAKAMKATLFFSSATHNINVKKILKFITAKLFNLPWTLDRNLTLGEPIIDF